MAMTATGIDADTVDAERLQAERAERSEEREDQGRRAEAGFGRDAPPAAAKPPAPRRRGEPLGEPAALSAGLRALLDMLADAPLTVNELENLDYIHPPLLENDYLVWTRKGSTLAYSEAKDLLGHTGGLSEKSRMTQAFGTFAEQNLTLTRTANLTQALQKLLLGEVEYVLAGRYSGMAAAQALGMANDLLAFEQPIDRPGLFLAVSHNSACNDPWLRGQFAKKMTELPASGLTEAALQRNIERWKAQQQQPQPPVSAPKQ